MRLSMMAETSSGFELISGAPEQLTLIPTVSLGEMKWDQASWSPVAPVSSRMPRESILFTALALMLFEAASTARSLRTRTARPGYGPGKPIFPDGWKRVTMWYLGTVP